MMDQRNNNIVAILLDNAPNMLAVIGAITVAFSVLSDVAYFSQVDMRLFSVLNMSDHLGSIVVWVPFGAASVGLGVYMAWLTEGTKFGEWISKRAEQKRQERFQNDAEKIRQYLHAKLDVSELKWAIGALILTFAAYASGGHWLVVMTGLYFSALLLCFALLHPVAVRMVMRGQPSVFVGLFAVLGCAIGVAYVGVSEARSQLSETAADHKVVLNDTESKVLDVVLMRSVSQGVLIRDASKGEVSLVPWQSIREISRKQTAAQPAPVCRWFGWCWNEKIEPTASGDTSASETPTDSEN